MPIHTPSSPTPSASKRALPHHPIPPSHPPCPKHPLHYPTLSAPPFPPPERHYRHFTVNDDEWADSATSWHNREWADSDFAAPSTSPSSPNASDDPIYHPLNHLHGGVLMGPCTCRNGSLHDHSKLVAGKATVQENGEGIDPVPKQEERVEDAQRHLLFGDEKAHEKVVREAVGVLRESENRMGR